MWNVFSINSPPISSASVNSIVDVIIVIIIFVVFFIFLFLFFSYINSIIIHPIPYTGVYGPYSIPLFPFIIVSIMNPNIDVMKKYFI